LRRFRQHGHPGPSKADARATLAERAPAACAHLVFRASFEEPMLALISLPPRVRSALALASVGASLVTFALATAKPAPASTEVPQPVNSVDAGLRVAVMIEGDGVYGSGILIDPRRGMVITNQHVVQDMHTIRLTGYTGRTSLGVVVSTDRKRDL